MALIVASDKPKILKVTSLQLTVLFFSCSKSCSFDNISLRFALSQIDV